MHASPLFHRVPAARPWYAQRWPWLLMLGPGLVVVAASFTCWLAFTRQDAMVVENYYQQGLAINQGLRRDGAATALGLAMRIDYSAAAGVVHGRLSSHGQALAGAFHLHLAHATRPDKDLDLAAQTDAQGNFNIALPLLDGGRWQVLVEGAQRDWRLNGEWDWPRQSGMDLVADPAPVD